jgi:hypothetical protein
MQVLSSIELDLQILWGPHFSLKCDGISNIVNQVWHRQSRLYKSVDLTFLGGLTMTIRSRQSIIAQWNTLINTNN